MNPVEYLNETWSELKKVRWPTTRQTIRLTIIVIAISLLVGTYIGGLDYLFTNLLTTLVK